MSEVNSLKVDNLALGVGGASSASVHDDDDEADKTGASALNDEDADMVHLATSLASDLADLVHSMNLAALGDGR